MRLFSAAIFILSFSQSIAFVPQSRAFLATSNPGSSNVILFERPDSSAAVAHALEMSKKFGPTSKEAASAWDIVEELDSSDNRCVLDLLIQCLYNLILLCKAVDVRVLTTGR